MSGPTKAQLEVELAEARARLAAAPVVKPPSRVLEAEALAGCVRALDELKTDSGTTWNSSKVVDKAAVKRLLHLLADKYGVDLYA